MRYGKIQLTEEEGKQKIDNIEELTQRNLVSMNQEQKEGILMNTLILCEKPSQAMDLSTVFVGWRVYIKNSGLTFKST